MLAAVIIQLAEVSACLLELGLEGSEAIVNECVELLGRVGEELVELHVLHLALHAAAEHLPQAAARNYLEELLHEVQFRRQFLFQLLERLLQSTQEARQEVAQLATYAK